MTTLLFSHVNMPRYGTINLYYGKRTYNRVTSPAVNGNAAALTTEQSVGSSPSSFLWLMFWRSENGVNGSFATTIPAKLLHQTRKDTRGVINKPSQTEAKRKWYSLRELAWVQ